MKDIDNNIDALALFNTMLGLINMSKNGEQQDILSRIEHKLDLLLKERKHNEDN